MRNIDRLGLIDRIGRELQSRMSYSDITAYLGRWGVDTTKPTSDVNSKWVYTKELLLDEPDDRVLQIADELELPHGYVVLSANETVDAKFWEPQHFRLFLCHLATFKSKTAALQRALRDYGISAFVAHVDIEPTREWQDEIEAGLMSMDALAAILVPGFNSSKWTDQEIGVAIGRGVLVIPVIRGLDPYGFIGKYQGLRVNGRTTAQVASGVFEILAASPKTRTRMLGCFVDSTLALTREEDAVSRIGKLSLVQDIPMGHLERLRIGASNAPAFREGAGRLALNRYLEERGLRRIDRVEVWPGGRDDDLPF